MNRADKKRKVSPFVPEYIRAHVHDVAVYIRNSDGEAGTRLAVAALNDYPTLNRLAPYMWRDYGFGSHAWIGHRDHEDLSELINQRGYAMERLSLRFNQDDWASIDALGFALARPVAHAAAALLRFAHDYERVTRIAAPGFRARSIYSLKEETPWVGFGTRDTSI